MNIASALQLIALIGSAIDAARAAGKTELSEADMQAIRTHQNKSDAEYDARMKDVEARLDEEEE